MAVKISVIMPVYNAGNFLNTAIDSVISQDFKDIQLILVDDGSIDGSSEICDKYAKNDSRIIVIHQENRGICNARNEALSIAEGEYVAFIDHDDEYLPDLLAKSYMCAVKTNADVVKFCKKYFYFNKERVVRVKSNKFGNTVYEGKEIVKAFTELFDTAIFSCVWDGLYRLDLLKKYNIKFDEYFKKGGEDIDFNMKVMEKMNVFSTISQVFYNHYVRTGFSTSSKFEDRMLEDQKILAERIKQTYLKLNGNFLDEDIDFIYIMLITYINNSIMLLVHPNCIYKRNHKIEIIKNLVKADFLPNSFMKVSSIIIFKKSFKAGLSYFLLKNKLYSILYFMFYVRKKWNQFGLMYRLIR